jgi:hypothetical protein
MYLGNEEALSALIKDINQKFTGSFIPKFQIDITSSVFQDTFIKGNQNFVKFL